MNEEMPWVNLTQEEVDTLRKSKKELTEYAKEKLRKMTEEASKRERANELYQDALQELDNLAVGDVESDDFMNAYLIIQTALKVALGEEDI
jgi:Zn-dependent M16 (insulinase) family peptidase